MLRDGTDRLESTGVWHIAAPALHDAFRAASDGFTFGPGEGLPGRVLEAGAPVWLADVTQENLPRRPQGLGGALAFPVVAEGRVVAVLEFFARLPAEPDERLMTVAKQVAVHLDRVAERLAARDQLAHQSMHDALTGLPNRLLFEEGLDVALALARRRSTYVAVLFLDADRFKVINDTLGHRTGDDILVEIARRMKAAVRASDVVARFGGDEFAILVQDLADERDALRIADTVQLALGAPFRLDGEEHSLSASIGIAISGGRRATPELMLRDADSAMYRAKELGRGRAEIFDERLRARLEERLRTERELRTGIEAGQLRLVYQPVFGLDDRRAHSVEALVRWDHPERGTLAPGEFLQIAEESGLILPLGEWVLGEACRQASAWRAQMGDAAPLPINVNLAARQLAQGGLVETIERLLAASGAAPSDIALEITESAVIENTLAAAETLERLKQLGFQVLLDDFGTGYSSLSYPQRLPIDVLKIDRSFVSGLGEDRHAWAIVRAIVGMAEALDIAVVAEGVETAAQASMAHDLGCGFAQGYYFARPSRPEDVAGLVASV
jgi:diguanylate cyclase (GGDEF)-like protein